MSVRRMCYHEAARESSPVTAGVDGTGPGRKRESVTTRKQRTKSLGGAVNGRIDPEQREYLEATAGREGGLSAALRVAIDKAILLDTIRQQAQERGGVEHVDPELKRLVDSERYLIVSRDLTDVDELA